MIQSTIRNIVFDLGGVIIDIDPAISFSAIQALAANPASVMEQFSEHADLFLDYEKGLIDDETFRNGVRELTQRPDLDAAIIDQTWCRMLLQVPQERLQLLNQLKEKYRTLVLSNTNAIHVEAFNRMIASVSSQPTIDHFFERVYYSHQLNMRKPEAEIYQFIVEDSQLIPHETLFLDDRVENLVAAEKLGIVTRQVTPQCGIIEIFS